MNDIYHWGVWLFWVVFYTIVICVCFVGRKKNSNKGWLLFIIAEILFLLTHIPSIFFLYYINLKTYTYYNYFTSGLIIPITMIIWLVGLYYLATNKK